MVSICMITYNHDSYISEAIEAIMMQKTSFPIELIIGEDCSTDNTRKICQEYYSKYPDKIQLILHKKNIGGIANFITTLKSCRGKYIALCEGDDYWIDQNKLQKQVDFMEENDCVPFCFHNAKTHHIDTNIVDDFNKNLMSGYFSTKDLLLKEWFIPTASLFIRTNSLPNTFPEWFYKVYSGDFALELLLSTKGDFFYIDERMSVYRKNAINSLSINGLKRVKLVKKHLYLLKNFKKSNLSDNNYAFFYAITKTRYKLLKNYIIEKLPFTLRLKNTISNNIIKYLVINK